MNLEELYQQKKLFISKIRPYLHNTDVAEDIVQDAFIKAINKFHQYDETKSKLKTWFTTILFSTLWNYLRKEKKLPTFSSLEILENFAQFISREEFAFRKYIQSVPNEAHRKVLICAFILGHTTQETSSITGVNEENIRKIIERSKGKYNVF